MAETTVAPSTHHSQATPAAVLQPKRFRDVLMLDVLMLDVLMLDVLMLDGAMLDGAMLHGAMLHVAMLHVAMLHVAMLHVAMLHVAMLHGAMLHVVMLQGAMLHGAMLDVAMLDGTMLHAVLLHGAMLDAAMPDAAMPDAAMPDAAMPDAAMPDAAMPDAAMPRLRALGAILQAEVSPSVVIQLAIPWAAGRQVLVSPIFANLAKLFHPEPVVQICSRETSAMGLQGIHFHRAKVRVPVSALPHWRHRKTAERSQVNQWFPQPAVVEQKLISHK
jgi:hypothetical protein